MEIHLQVIDHVVAMKKVIVGQKVSGQKYCISGQKVLIFFLFYIYCCIKHI